MHTTEAAEEEPALPASGWHVAAACVLPALALPDGGCDYYGLGVKANVGAVHYTHFLLLYVAGKPLLDAALTLLLIAAAGVAVALAYHRRQISLYRGLYDAERKERQAQEAPRAAEGRHRATMDHMMEGCQIIAPDWRYLYVNPAVAVQARKAPQELLGRTMMEAFPGIDHTDMFANLRRCMEDGTAQQIENQFHYEDGSSRWFELRIQRVPEGVFVLSLDITERKLAQQRLEQAVSDLERSNRELEQFAYVASHDLQEPLRMVASYTQLLEERYRDGLDEDAREFIRFAVDGANRMQGLIRDLLLYSRITTRGRPLEPVDARQALDDALANLRRAVEECGAAVTDGSLPTILGDRTQLASLFQNLIGNALKFRREGVAPRIGVAARADGAFYEFTVQDNGIGIEQKHFERIFTIFQRLHGREQYPGTGIGLALCKRIVERHGGRIWLESTPGAGTVFHFTLRAASSEGAAP